jgi:cytidine deaminase
MKGKPGYIGRGRHKFDSKSMYRKDKKYFCPCSHCNKVLTYNYGIEAYLHGVVI